MEAAHMQIGVHTNERTQTHSVRSSLVVTPTSTNEVDMSELYERATEPALVVTASSLENINKYNTKISILR